MLLIPYLVIHLALKRVYAIVWGVILVLVCIVKLIKRKIIKPPKQSLHNCNRWIVDVVNLTAKESNGIIGFGNCLDGKIPLGRTHVHNFACHTAALMNGSGRWRFGSITLYMQQKL
jgi:hypothetical protein